PDEAAALREQHSEITPGYHMNKKHWITLEGGGSLDRSLVEELVTDSYLLVVANLPKAQQPVDPATFAGRDRTQRSGAGTAPTGFTPLDHRRALPRQEALGLRGRRPGPHHRPRREPGHRLLRPGTRLGSPQPSARGSLTATRAPEEGRRLRPPVDGL
ncbi:hypothetical protein B5181_10520, partial [Streptomyces sp. 4F]